MLSPNRKIYAKNLTAIGQWGFLLVITVLALGCSSSANRDACIDPGPFVFSATTDSLGIEAFQALPQSDQQSRRNLADQWLDRFEDEKHPSDRIRALGNAAGLAPDDPSIWLQQAHLWRWLGDYLKTVECLESAAAAVRNFNPNVHSWSKREMQRRTAVARAWLHYDRGEWQLGLEWARAARQVASSDASVRLIYGLLAGHAGLRSEAQGPTDDLGRVDEDFSDISWTRASYRVSTGQYRQAFNLIMDLNPNRSHKAECWREMGEIAEYLSEFSRAGRWYEESVSALPFRSTHCLVSIKNSRLKPGSKGTWLKVWLAFDRYYVTGSYSAYTSLAFKRFQDAKKPENKDFWAGQVVNATGVLLRKKMDEPWAYRARGLVFASVGKSDRARKDLKRASKELAELGQTDFEVEATLGHLYLDKENQVRALQHLNAAARLDPHAASVWRDLGLALIMSGQPKEAESALTRALDLDPDSATSWYNRGLLYLHRSDYTRATADLEKAAALAPDNQEVIKLLQQAKVLERQKRR